MERAPSRRVLAACGLALVSGVTTGCGESDRGVGEVRGAARPAPQVAARAAEQAEASAALGAAASAPPILFGDLHVHSTFSIDAFLQSLPIFGGEGAHPPADACDFARHCAALDFFSINDHAESLPPGRWEETLESIRQCDARAGAHRVPDLVAFMGYEWTQAGPSPETHWGHKNVVFRGLGPGDVAPRPIDSLPPDVAEGAQGIGAVSWLAQLESLGLVADLVWLMEQLATAEPCEPGVDTRELPGDCRESAEDPRALFEKLEQGGYETLVIPHGLAWGQHAPPGANLATQLAPGQHDPARQRLLEVHSGHGNSEEFRAVQRLPSGPEGELVCPRPTDDFLPCCWRAGELMRERCGDLPEDECEARVREARRLALEAGTAPNLVFPETSVEEWLDCDQCRDCFKPAFNLRPGMTAQAAAALVSAAPTGERFRFGFIASSDNHDGRPGTGYKQVARQETTDVRGLQSPRLDAVLRPFVFGSSDDPQRAQPVAWEERGFRGLFNKERVASFLYPGGLVAVHAQRDRDAIWQALQRKQVYGTSGPRILLWFDLLREDGARVPMGGEVARSRPPVFEVRAIGSFVQQPGCPSESVAALGAERIEHLCLGECYHPGDERHRVERVEVVRIRPQREPGEDLAELIEDPWLTLPCDGDPAGCVVQFDDPDFERDTVYYVRALQAATPAINGGQLRTAFEEAADGSRQARSVTPCYAGWRTAWDDDCLSPVHERAWSSPIYVDYALD